MVRRFVTLILASIGLVSTSCEGPDVMSERTDFRDVVGAYAANFGSAVYDSLFLHSDSTYIRIYARSSEEVVVDTGLFRFAEIGNRDYFFYSSDFLLLEPLPDQGFGAPSWDSCIRDTIGMCVPIKKLGNSIRIYYYYPESWCYRKRI